MKDNSGSISKKCLDLIVIVLFILIIFVPTVFKVIDENFEVHLDFPLVGYSDVVERPTFSLDSFRTGDYQQNYTAWYNGSFAPRGFLIKLANSIDYDWFSVGNNVVGKNDDIFQSPYIVEALAIGDGFNYSLESNQANMQQYVATLESLDQKLESIGKHLFVVVTPNKARFDYDNIPYSYMIQSNPDNITQSEYFRELITETDVNCYFADEEAATFEYPIFYPAGIHWSRSYEQLISARIIEELSEVTGCDYRNVCLGDIESSPNPYWRDFDILDNMNVWYAPETTYYQYNTYRDYPEHYTELRALVIIDSFGLGLQRDLSELYPYDDVSFVFYNNYIMDLRNNYIPLYDDWNNLDMQYYLDTTDVIIIEMNEFNIYSHFNLFESMLDSFLDTYVPGTYEHNYPSHIRFSSDEPVNLEGSLGAFVDPGNNFIPVNSCEFTLTGEELANGFRAELNPDYPVEAPVYIYINGNLVAVNDSEHSICVDSSEYYSSSVDEYEVEFFADYAFSLTYVGGI